MGKCKKEINDLFLKAKKNNRAEIPKSIENKLWAKMRVKRNFVITNSRRLKKSFLIYIGGSK